MKSKTIHNLLEVNDELKNTTLKGLNLTKSEVEEAVQKVLEWLKAQPHLQDVKPDARHIEFLFVGSKGSTERTKQAIDQYYTMKTKIPEFFMNRDSSKTDFRVAFEGISCIMMYPVTSLGYRVMSMKCFPDSSRFNINDFYKIMLMLVEINTRLDYASGFIVVCDFANLTMGHLIKMSPVAVKKAVYAMLGPFLIRVKGVHYLNCPSYAEPFVTMFRSLLKPKLQKRIFVHKNLESLHTVVDKAVLPEDFGGTQKSIREIEELWFDELLNWRDWFLEEDKYIADESKRPQETNPDEFLGIHGSFRKLALD